METQDEDTVKLYAKDAEMKNSKLDELNQMIDVELKELRAKGQYLLMTP